MNNFALIPSVTIPLDPDAGTTSTFCKYQINFRNPEGEYAYSASACRYGRNTIWLVRVRNISDADWVELSAKPDVYAFPPDDRLNTPVTDRERLVTFFDGYKVPAHWITATTTYLDILKSIARIGHVLQRYYGVHGRELFDDGIDLDTRFRDMPVKAMDSLQKVVNEKISRPMPINHNSPLYHVLKQMGDRLTDPITVGDYTL